MSSTLRILISLPASLWELVVTYLPGEVGHLLRRRFWARRLRFLGKNVLIDVGVHIRNADFVEIDDNCWIDRNVTIIAGIDRSSREKIIRVNPEYQRGAGVVRIGKNVHVGSDTLLSGITGGIDIGDDCCFSSGCCVYAFSHHYRSAADPAKSDVHFGSMASHDRQCIVEGPVVIGNNTGVALKSIVLPGVTISENSFVRIGAVVSGRYLEPNNILAGDPAKVIGPRFLQSGNG